MDFYNSGQLNIDKNKSLITEKAHDLGFADIGFAKAEKLNHLEKPLHDWLERGYHGEMSWMEKNVDLRLDPTKLFHGAKTILSLISWYYSPAYENQCGVSRYAVGRDYHKVLRKKGNQLVSYIKELLGDVNARVFVDSAPLMEREWAKLSGLGWIGKNGCLIQPQKGSWFFLAEIILDAAIPPDPPEQADLCGSCTRCIRACPTEALLGNGLLDARRCISYLTIELNDKSSKADDLQWNDWIFGCDICQEVCPWNRKPIHHLMEDFTPRNSIMGIKKGLELKTMAADELGEHIKGTPLNRARSEGLIANFQWLNHATGQKESS